MRVMVLVKATEDMHKLAGESKPIKEGYLKNAKNESNPGKKWDEIMDAFIKTSKELSEVVAKDATTLFIGTVCIGVGNGMVEAACNPLVVSLYPDNKTTMLNRFHVWFPGGIVIGGLISFLLLEKMHMDWRIMVAILFIPAVIYGLMFWKLEFPRTERVVKGISTKEMFMSCLNPLYIIMILCMFMTAATELGTGTWITALLSGAGVSGILILVFINGVMAIGRSFAGPIVHRLNPNGMLIFSSVFAAIGLFLLSRSSGYMAFGAAFVFAAGICFFWPTMVGFIAENYPKTGALGLAIIGGAGMLSVSFVLPVIGRWYDAGIAARVLEIRKETVRESLSDFRNVEHRLEHVTTVHGIEFINDSRAVKNSLELSYITLPRCARILGKKKVILGANPALAC